MYSALSSVIRHAAVTSSRLRASYDRARVATALMLHSHCASVAITTSAQCECTIKTCFQRAVVVARSHFKGQTPTAEFLTFWLESNGRAMIFDGLFGTTDFENGKNSNTANYDNGMVGNKALGLTEMNSTPPHLIT